MNTKLLVLPLLILLGCSRESDTIPELESSEEPEVEVVYEPGTRTEKGGLILSQDLLLDKDMNFVYMHIDGFEDKLMDRNTGLVYVSNLVIDNVSRIVYESFKEDFDFIAVKVPLRGYWPPHFLATGCPAAGIGCDYFDIQLNRLKGFPVFKGDTGFGGYVAMHEIGHCWGNKGVVPTNDEFHWGYSNVGGFLGGYDELTYLGDNTYQGGFVRDGVLSNNPYTTDKYGNLELYLMGLIPASELLPIIVAENPEPLSDNGEQWGRFTADGLTTIQPGDFIAKWGERLPTFENSQKSFKMLVVVVSGENIIKAEKSEEESLSLGRYIEEFSDQGSIQNIDSYEKFNFWKATGGRATMETKISMDNLKDIVQ